MSVAGLLNINTNHLKNGFSAQISPRDQFPLNFENQIRDKVKTQRREKNSNRLDYSRVFEEINKDSSRENSMYKTLNQFDAMKLDALSSDSNP